MNLLPYLVLHLQKMASFFRMPDDSMRVWGHQFRWTSQHQTAAELRHLLFSYDKLANDALDRIDEISPPPTKGWKCPHGSGPGQRDLYALLEEHAEEDETLGKLWNEVTNPPDWVDWEQIERGQRVVYQFNAQVLLGLLYKSLLGGMGAFRVVETLSKTGGFGVQVTRRRLLETLQHFMEVVEDIGAVKPGGKGFISSVRVRLLHAAVRRRLMQLEAERPGYFDVNHLGVPINDLHSIGTISVYSVAIVYMALPRQGIYLTQQQIADYLALWRWVGHLLGTPVDWMDTPESAKSMMESVMVSEIHPSTGSSILANNILTAEANVPPLWAPREYLVAQAYLMNGDDLSQALGIEKPLLRHRLLSWFQCFVLMGISYTYPFLPARVQRRRDQRFRNIANAMITSQKIGGIGEASRFELQYVPEHGKTTELGFIKSVAKDEKPRKTYTAVIPIVTGLVLAALAVFQLAKVSKSLTLYGVSSLMKGQALRALS
ncbi:hypothetical protein HJFPF1_00477 [Paramyrothecium foliicola]|nr:hypothetical protein HJFPF1_00477 [Paramyrothecium foliicola]